MYTIGAPVGFGGGPDGLRLAISVERRIDTSIHWGVGISRRGASLLRDIRIRTGGVGTIRGNPLLRRAGRVGTQLGVFRGVQDHRVARAGKGVGHAEEVLGGVPAPRRLVPGHAEALRQALGRVALALRGLPHGGVAHRFGWGFPAHGALAL